MIPRPDTSTTTAGPGEEAATTSLSLCEELAARLSLCCTVKLCPATLTSLVVPLALIPAIGVVAFAAFGGVVEPAGVRAADGEIGRDAVFGSEIGERHGIGRGHDTCVVEGTVRSRPRCCRDAVSAPTCALPMIGRRGWIVQ